MERWRGKTALVTGASAGIGYAIAQALAEAGMNVIGCARNPASLEDLKKKLPSTAGKLHPMKADLTKEEEIMALFKEITAKFGHVDILVNNAGGAQPGELVSQSTADWQQMFNLNVLATTICSREVIQLLEKDKIEDGHIININSIAGHVNMALINGGFNFYSAAKHMITALTNSLHTELVQKKSKIRVTSISPGLVGSRAVEEFGKNSSVALFGGLTPLDCKDIADAVIYVVGVPSNVVITELTIVPNGQLK